uniref:ATP synthase F0 subunit 8 n=1 Tax=Rhinophis philippinus TaxID=196471 RepID=D2W931_9SAUR|nr:ATP synthase F0 subunit 8 [Rhinophis philippinus]
MPQLDIVFISLTFAWAWFTLIALALKIQTTQMKKNPDHTPKKSSKSTWNLPWT